MAIVVAIRSIRTDSGLNAALRLPGCPLEQCMRWHPFRIPSPLLTLTIHTSQTSARGRNARSSRDAMTTLPGLRAASSLAPYARGAMSFADADTPRSMNTLSTVTPSILRVAALD
jgi:hypothetical protein